MISFKSEISPQNQIESNTLQIRLYIYKLVISVTVRARRTKIEEEKNSCRNQKFRISRQKQQQVTVLSIVI